MTPVLDRSPSKRLGEALKRAAGGTRRVWKLSLRKASQHAQTTWIEFSRLSPDTRAKARAKARARARAKVSATVVSTRSNEAGAAVGKALGNADENAVLRRALQHVGEELGLSQQVIAQAVGEVSSFFDPDDPDQESGSISSFTYQRIGLMLRLHDSLSSLVGNNVEHMRGWMGALNRSTGGIPAKQLKDPDQLGKLVCYLEAFDH